MCQSKHIRETVWRIKQPLIIKWQLNKQVLYTQMLFYEAYARLFRTYVGKLYLKKDLRKMSHWANFQCSYANRLGTRISNSFWEDVQKSIRLSDEILLINVSEVSIQQPRIYCICCVYPHKRAFGINFLPLAYKIFRLNQIKYLLNSSNSINNPRIQFSG